MHAAWLLIMHLSHFPLPPHPQETSFGSFNAQITDPRRSGKSGGHLTQNDLQMSNSSCTFSVTTLNAQGSAEGRGAVLSRGWFRRLRFSIIEYFLSLLFFLSLSLFVLKLLLRTKWHRRKRVERQKGQSQRGGIALKRFWFTAKASCIF